MLKNILLKNQKANQQNIQNCNDYSSRITKQSIITALIQIENTSWYIKESKSD